MILHRLREWLHRTLLCRFGRHVGGNMPFGDQMQYSRCMWCDHESQLIGGVWRDYIRPPRPDWKEWRRRDVNRENS